MEYGKNGGDKSGFVAVKKKGVRMKKRSPKMKIIVFKKPGKQQK